MWIWQSTFYWTIYGYIYVTITKTATQKKPIDLSVILNDIPIKLTTVHEKLYKHWEIINFIAPISKNLNTVGQYVIFC